MMKPQRVISALEPLFVCGLVLTVALVGLSTLSTMISRHVQPLASVALAPEEPAPIAVANDESRPTKNR